MDDVSKVLENSSYAMRSVLHSSKISPLAQGGKETQTTILIISFQGRECCNGFNQKQQSPVCSFGSVIFVFFSFDVAVCEEGIKIHPTRCQRKEAPAKDRLVA